MVLFGVIALATLAVFASSAAAKTFTVTRNDDPVPTVCDQGDCSLREAVLAANVHQGTDTVEFANGLSGSTIQLAHGELSIRSKVTIDGPGAKKLTVSGNHLSRVFHMTGGRITIQGLAVRDGRETATPTGPTCPDTSAPAFTLGGGILEDKGSLKLDHVLVRNNTVTTALGGIIGGGGIANIDGTLTVKRSRVTQNTVDGGGISGGGGILNCVGIVKLNRTRLDNSSVSDASIDVGGGIANGLGAAHNTGQLTVNKSTIEENDVSSDAIPGGGGLSTSGGPVTVMNSTINDNSVTATGNGTLADGGGAEISNAKATFTNSTIANNVASGKFADGGGILAGAPAKRSSCTASRWRETAPTAPTRRAATWRHPTRSTPSTRSSRRGRRRPEAIAKERPSPRSTTSRTWTVAASTATAIESTGIPSSSGTSSTTGAPRTRSR